MTSQTAKLNPPPAWKLWDNPVFLRYCRSRLRLKGLLPSLLLTVIFSAFAYLIAPMSSERLEENRARYGSSMEQQLKSLEREAKRNPGLQQEVERYRENMSREGIEAHPRESYMHQRMALLPLLAIQALILFLIGTGQVAGGMTSERDDGMVDYQRLAPMTPLTKTLGYLIGLPVREWVMFLSTLPFMGLALWRGEVPFSAWGPVALIFFTSVILYHLTGLVAGTVFKNRRWAFLICMAMIFLLYFLVPQGSRFGLPFLRYITMWPAMLESVHILPPSLARNLREVAAHAEGAGVNFFDWNFSDVAFTLIVQGSFILTMLVMVWRKWRQADSHLLSKGWALLVFGWLCILPLGNAIPGIADGSIFPARNLRAMLNGTPTTPQLPDAFLICGFYGLMMLLFLIIVVLLLTPVRDMQTRGLRRAAKLGRRSAPLLSDEYSAFGMVVLLTLCGAASWTWFTRSALGSDWFHADPGMMAFVVFLGVLAPVTLGLHALLESRGGKWPFLAVVFVGLVPVLASLVVAAASHRSPAPAALTAGASPGTLTFYAVNQVMPETFSSGDGDGAGADFRRAARLSVIVYPILYSAGALFFITGLRRHWKKLRRAGT